MSFESVCQHLLAPTELNSDKLEAVLASMYQHDLDYADLFFQSSRHESWVLEDGIVKEGSFNIEKGVGVRAVSAEKTGFAYSDQLSFEALQQAANAARGIAGAGQSVKNKILTPKPTKIIYPELDPLACLEKEAKINLLKISLLFKNQ